MGTGGSFLRSQDDDDILGTDLDGNGVIKRIPIEMKPRGKLGLRSVSSFGRKPKGGSLRSALSIDLENPEVERIRKEFEMFRLNKENEIQSMQKKEQKLEMENKRMRAELLALQNTCTKLRNEKDGCLDAEMSALARAAAFESDRDKVQRQFKIFRETKENEIQNLLRAKRELESKLTKFAHYLPHDDMDSVSRTGDASIGNSNPGDWWNALESEPSLGSTVQLHQPPFLRGPEFANTIMELEGPFTNVNKDDWSTALANLTQIVPSIPDHTISSILRIYISTTQDMYPELELLARDYASHLSNLCEGEGRGLVIVHLPCEDSDNISTLLYERQIRSRRRQLDLASIFVVLLGETTNRYSSYEIKHGHLECTEVRPTVYCLKETAGKGTKSSQNEAKEIKKKIKEGRNVKVISGYTTPAKGTELLYQELETILKKELGIDQKEKTEGDAIAVVEESCGGAVWDMHYDYEQMEALGYAVHSTCELGFERYYERLNAHVSAAGPLPPLMVTGGSGSGRSLLLSKWIQLQQEKCPGTLVLFHFVGSPSSISADPVTMIRRLTSQLMQHVSTAPALSGDPVRLVEEFPRWLEKVSSKSPAGTILILDSVDRFPQVEVHLKWLLDPLPVDARVIVSCHEDKCLQAWRSWPTLSLESLTNKNVKELVRAELAPLDAFITPDLEAKILKHCRTPASCCPLYVMILARHVASLCHHEEKLVENMGRLLSAPDCEDLCMLLFDILLADYQTPETLGIGKQILSYLCASRCGMREEELFKLIPTLTWAFLCQFYEAFSSHLILKYHSGLITFAHQQVKQAAIDYCFGKDSLAGSFESTQQELEEFFTHFLEPGQVSCRVCDELPWLIRQTGNKEKLKDCILNLCVFQRLYAKGRCSELIGYWQTVGGDKTSMAVAYFQATKRLEESAGQSDMVTLPGIADMYETLGRFLKDMGLLKQALPALQRALEVRETALDPDHPVVARSLHQLAGLHAQWGKFTTAQAYYQQALEIYENAYGRDHHLVAKELDALAVLYQKQDKHDQAEPLKKRAVSIKKKVRSLRLQQGQMRGIDLLRRRTLHLEELAMGSESPEQARTLNELGVLYYLQGNVDTAESFFKRSLEMRESTLGSDHPDLAQSLNNLAAFYNDRKQFDKAEPLYERALQIRLKHLNGESPACAGIIKNLAMLYKKQGKFDKAEPLYKQAVDIREKSFGPFHPSVATANVNLAVLYSQQNKYSDAEPLYEKALKIYEDSLGPNHPAVAETLRNLAVMKYEMKDFETAAKLYKRATEIKESEANYAGKVLSRRSSSGDTNSTIKLNN